MLGNRRFIAEWNGDKQQRAATAGLACRHGPVKLSHSGNGKPWAMLQSLAALPLKEPLSTGYRVTRQVIPISQKTRANGTRATWRACIWMSRRNPT